MSRCGSCPIYDQTEYRVCCPGGLCEIECADKLHSLYYKMVAHIQELEKLPLDKMPDARLTKLLAYEQTGLQPRDVQTMLDAQIKGKETKQKQPKVTVPFPIPTVKRAKDQWPTNFKMTGEFIFIGQDNSVGLHQGDIYHLVVKRKGPDEKVWVYWYDNRRKQHPYDTMDSFNKNWERVK